MNTTRRVFVKNCASACALGAFGITGCSEARAGDVYPGWKPGEMDLHFVYTGCGENMFYRLPDGTAVLNDTGDFYRPKSLAEIPLLPSPDRLGGEWMSRYISRVYSEKTIDHLVLSHWHSDHVGHARFDEKDTPNAAYRFKTLEDGTRVNGFTCVARDYRFKRYLDHQGAARGQYGSAETSLPLLETWLEKEKKNGLVVEEFVPGSTERIPLLRDPGRYAGKFSVRCICANGKIWDGGNGFHDYAADHVAATGEKTLSQNTLSMGFVIEYGRFRYWAGGDVCGWFKAKDGSGVDYEALVGRRVGPVTVCKMNHHGCPDAMNEGFVRAVRADAYVACVWDPWQTHEQTLSLLTSREINGGRDPLIVPNLLPQSQAARCKDKAFMKNVVTRSPSHVVVKVLPGGTAYRIYLLDARDESMRILRRIDRAV